MGGIVSTRDKDGIPMRISRSQDNSAKISSERKSDLDKPNELGNFAKKDCGDKNIQELDRKADGGNGKDSGKPDLHKAKETPDGTIRPSHEEQEHLLSELMDKSSLFLEDARVVNLNEKQTRLLRLRSSVHYQQEGLTQKLRDGNLQVAHRLQNEIDDKSKAIGQLENEIGDLEANAWEPVVKGTTVLFYYNWATGKTENSHLRPKDKNGDYARIRSSITLGSSLNSDEERVLWQAMRQRSSTVKTLNGSWRQCTDLASGSVYYTNSRTGVSQWETPFEGPLDESCEPKHGVFGDDAPAVTQEDDQGHYYQSSFRQELRHASSTRPAPAVAAAAAADEEEGGGEGEEEEPYEEEPMDEEHTGWEAITNSDGEILYFYNYSTGEWTHDCPDAWDRESYQQADWSGTNGHAGAGWYQEMETVVREEKDNVTAMQSLIRDLKAVLASAQLTGTAMAPAVEAFPVCEVAEATPMVGEEPTPNPAGQESTRKGNGTGSGNCPGGGEKCLAFSNLFNLDPQHLIESLEKEHADLIKQTNSRHFLEELKNKVAQQDILSHRRESVRKSIVARVSSRSSPMRSPMRSPTTPRAQGPMRSTLVSPKSESSVSALTLTTPQKHPPLSVQSGVEEHTGLSAGDALSPTLAAESHPQTGRVFRVDEIEDGPFEPQQVGSAVINI